ncbi:MAG TPA: MBG domain-containing protein, partial [Pyrinomonadaceae bacterium]
SYANNTDAGTAGASATYAGDTNHTGSSDSENFTIDQAPSITTVTCPTNVTYTGAALEPCTATVAGAGSLNQSLSVSYTNNTDAGAANASASYAGDANHTGSSDSENFTIDKASSTTVVTCPTNVTYDGTAQTPCSAVVTGAGGLNQSLMVSYSNNTNAGTANASATYAGDANHTGSSDSENFTIDPAASTTVVTCPTNVTYTGAAIEPCSAVVTGAGGLNQSLTVSYSNNIDAGTASASASYAGDANHTASSDSKNFTIDQASSTTVVTCPTNVTYTGAAQTPCTATVTGAGGLNQSLTLNYTNNTDAGTATASASFAGDANHTGSSDSKNFNIDQAPSITTVTCPTSVTYTGAALEPCTATVTGAGGLNQSLSVSYSDNVNAGTANASASYGGDANHTGSSDSESFTIDPAASTTAVTCPTNVTYTGAAQEPCTAIVTGAGGLNQALPVSYSNNTDAGTATASASYAGDANHTGSNDSKNFTIDKAATTTVVTCPTNVTYTGAALEPCSATVTGANLSEPVAVNYTNNTNAGAATASATYAESANYLGSSDSKNFTIDKAATTTTDTCPANVTYTGAAIEPCSAAVTGPGGLNETLTVSYADNVNAGTATASATYAETANYLGSSDSENFTIDKAASTTVVTCPASATYTGSALEPCTAAVTGAGGLNQSLTVSYTNNTNAGTATASASYAESANHLGSSDSKNFTIDKAATTTTVTCPTSVTYTGAAIEPCTASATGAGGLNQSLTVSYTNNVNVGAATASATYAASANHLGSTDSETFQITSKALAITANNPSKVYGQTVTFAGTEFTSVGLVGGDSVNSVTLTSAGAATLATVGNYPIVASAAVGTGLSNYTITYHDGTLTVTTAYCFIGFHSPIGGSVETGNGGSFADPVRAFKLGSTIPVKFTIKEVGCQGSAVTTGIHTLQALKYTNTTDADAPIDATPTDGATTGNQFRLTGTDWHFNLNTKGGFSQGTWLLRATLQDGSVHTVWVSIKK